MAGILGKHGLEIYWYVAIFNHCLRRLVRLMWPPRRNEKIFIFDNVRLMSSDMIKWFHALESCLMLIWSTFTFYLTDSPSNVWDSALMCRALSLCCCCGNHISLHPCFSFLTWILPVQLQIEDLTRKLRTGDLGIPVNPEDRSEKD